VDACDVTPENTATIFSDGRRFAHMPSVVEIKTHCESIGQIKSEHHPNIAETGRGEIKAENKTARASHPSRRARLSSPCHPPR
jgi:hypothetical protein